MVLCGAPCRMVRPGCRAVTGSSPRCKLAAPRHLAVPGHGKRRERECEEGARVSLNTLLAPLDRVDLIELDIQGAAFGVLSAAAEMLSRRVKRLRIATHTTEAESALRTLSRDLAWENLHDYLYGGVRATPWGPIYFGDGVQSWISPRL